MYEVFDSLHENNQALKSINANNLGGSMSNKLQCGNNMDIDTVYSKRMID